MIDRKVSRPAVNWRTAARAQFRLIPTAPRRGMLFFVVIGGLLLLTRSCQVSFDLPSFQVRMSGLTGLYPLFLIGSTLWALSVWHSEEPARRAYHWALPVDRRIHDLLRILAGGAWLGLFLLPMIGITILLQLFGETPAGTGMPAFWIFVTYLTGPFTVYLLCSIPALRSDHPALWILGTPIAGLTLWGISAFGGAAPLAQAMHAVWIGPVGILRAIALPIAAEILGDGSTPRWLPAAFLWLGLSLLAVVVASLRRVER